MWVLQNREWWPGRILSTDELSEMGIHRQSDCDLSIYLYSEVPGEGKGVVHLSSYRDVNSLDFFETSSEKAVTTNPILKEAIQNAIADSTANPLRGHTASSVAQSTSRSGAAARAPVPPVSRKHQQHVSHGTIESMLEPDLISLTKAVKAAYDAKDVQMLRMALASLEGVDAKVEDLEDTKIGVAVGDILGAEVFRPLWPLARTVISFWARHLPEETLAVIHAIKQDNNQQQPAKAATNDFSLWTSLEGIPSSMPESPASPLSPIGSPFQATASRKRPREGFRHQLMLALDNPSNDNRPLAADVERVAMELEKVVVKTDDRFTLLERVRNPVHSLLRSNLLDGTWTAAHYLSLPEETFSTEAEKEADRRRTEERMEAERKAKAALENVTSMFTCGTCGEKRCTYYEQQTRGGDEPSTKFITCLNCNITWTEE